MTHDNSHRALLLAFCAVVICFVGSTVYTQTRVTQLDDAAWTIANVAAVRIQALASLRAETHDLVQQLTDCVNRAQGELLDCGRVRATKEKIEGELQSYRSLPADPSHRDLREQIEEKIAALLNAVKRTLKEVDRGDPARARQVHDSEVRPALDGTRAALIESIERNAEQARRLALSIRSIRSQSTFAAYALDAMNVALGGIAIALAIAQLRRYTQLMESRRQLLERRAEELESFAGRVAHDVVSPLSAVSTFLAILDRHLPSAEEDKLRFGLDRAKRGLMRSTRIVSDLLDFAKAARPADGASAALVEVLEGLSEELKPLAREAGVELRIEFPREPCVVSCSPGVLMSLVDNLARNAIKYTADSQVRKVTIRAHIKRTTVRIEVADTGPGIPAEAQALVFEPFVRTSSAEGKPGTGLGLATVKRLATAHNGSVGVESTPGHGSVFWFELPRAPASGKLEDPKHPTGSTAHPA
ncbi:MAG TPA: ATP-binding protein [Myxococcaceae bacterium]|nr:ATP-binding protein [Myxococcaceae bacterium]